MAIAAIGLYAGLGVLSFRCTAQMNSPGPLAAALEVRITVQPNQAVQA